MNNIVLRGHIKDIEHSHDIEDIEFGKAKLLVKRLNGSEDVINLRFKSFSNIYKENDFVEISGNVRSYSYKIDEKTNKVIIYVFTYFDRIDEELTQDNYGELDGRICKINNLRTTRTKKHNIHFILANNILSSNNTKRLNSYIPCIAWGKIAKEISQLSVNTKLNVKGELHSREHKKIHEDGSVEIRVAHEFLVTDYEVID